MTPTQAQIAREALQNISIGGNGEQAWTIDEIRSYARYMLSELTAAAEVGEQGDIERLLDANRRMHDDINDMKPKIEAATIERCAQVADGYANSIGVPAPTIAAAIRALKDK